jgi:Na+/H+-dicarboxylate symporter
MGKIKVGAGLTVGFFLGYLFATPYLLAKFSCFIDPWKAIVAPVAAPSKRALAAAANQEKSNLRILKQGVDWQELNRGCPGQIWPGNWQYRPSL